MQLYLFCWKLQLEVLKRSYAWGQRGLSFQKTLNEKFLTSLPPHSKYSQYEVTVQFPALYFYVFYYQLNSELPHDCWSLNVLLCWLLDHRAASVPDNSVVKGVWLLKCNGHGKCEFQEKNKSKQKKKQQHNFAVQKNDRCHLVEGICCIDICGLAMRSWAVF